MYIFLSNRLHPESVWMVEQRGSDGDSAGWMILSVLELRRNTIRK